jgi:ketosteroid isomerase-like protein
MANTPEELEAAFTDRYNAHDLDGLMALIDDDAVFVTPDDGLRMSRDEMRAGFEASLADPDASLESDPPQVVVAGDVALIVAGWRMGGMSATATDVARRSPDGTWRYVIINPAGGGLPEPTGA